MVKNLCPGCRVALDPGRVKCGYAIEDVPGGRSLKGTLNLETLGQFLVELARLFAVEVILVGGGTNYREVLALVKEVFADAKIVVVDETGSTEEARRLYLQERGRGLLMRFLSNLFLLLFNPPLDGYAALSILRRYEPK